MPTSLPPDVLEAIRAALGAQYELDRTLGSGGMGSVLLAHDRTLERPVAIKVIHPELAATASFRQRFLQEARTIAKLRHHSIVGVHAAGEAAGVLYFVMEFVPGESLREALTRDGPMSPPDVAAILRDLADALACAHRNGVVHRDIKPENILLDADTGRARLTDFGIARSLAAAGDRMTGTGMAMGTPAYMSPEQAAGERDVDGRSDLYALGLVGYEMLAGAPPFVGKSPASVVMKQITEQPAPLISRVEGVPPALAGIIEKALAKDPDDRWADGDAMARALDAMTAGADVPGLGAGATPAPGGWPGAAPAGATTGARAGWRRRPILAALGVLALVLLIPIAFLVFARSGVPAGVDPRKSFLIIPFRVPPGDQSLAWLRDGSVSMLALNLAQWRDVSVVEYERSLDLLRDANLDGSEPISLAQARDLARRAGAWTVVMGEVSKQGDSLIATANLFAVESDKRIDQRQATAPASGDPRRLFDQLSATLLGLVGAPPLELEIAKTTTGSIEAYRHYLEGVRALNEWRLIPADSSLALALEADSTFALAWYKRSLASGWRRASDPNTMHYARMAMTHGARLPERERGLVEGNFEQQQQNWQAAQQRYVRLLARDSTDAEAWYALADAYFHDPDPATRAMNRTRSLAAFNRTLALDSTFHLAYSHKVDLYTDASRPGSAMVIENDTVRILSPDVAQQWGRARIDSARQRARELALRNAQQWVFTDEDAAPAYFALAEAYASSGDYARAAETLRRAMARPTTRQSDFAYRIASYELGARSPNALESLRQALREQAEDSLRQSGGARRFMNVLASANVALFSGALGDAYRVFSMVEAVDPHLPGTERAQNPIPTSTMLGPFRSAVVAGLGLDPATSRRQIASNIRVIDTMPGPTGVMTRQQSVALPYAAYMMTRDTVHFATIRRWSGSDPPPALIALAAIEAGDTARAMTLASRFSRGDTAKLVDPAHQETSGIIEAEVLTRIGDTRGALATLESMDPAKFTVLGLDPRWVFYPRTLIQRGELHEQLGETALADSMYSRVLELWKDADELGQPLVRQAQGRLAALRDARASVPVVTSPPR